MASCTDFPFPALIFCLLLVRPSQASEVDPDYNPDYTPPSSPPKTQHPFSGKRCDYSSCREGQVACNVLADSTGCLCPGFTLQNVAPEAPSLMSVSWNGSDVVALWCAPNSYVTGYTVTVRQTLTGKEDRLTLGQDKRSGVLGHIDHVSEVCVVAVNDAGQSPETASCLPYEPRDSSLPLKAGLIGGALVLLMLVLLGVLLWRRQRQRKQQSGISMQDAEEGPR
ncbi:leucine-rich repeat neuronal protein 4 [Larimichthys crocea]|uniref:leucine-rich repeat neuronal protein 4 n=1 Tax=Larimichthys crocea TaxID=215358 RepID=UPI000622E6BD|nr:leucine-rich repeat neuronal protein 4 [Larimichthys crocea]XP_027129528.1 leucine-rich repeat neuronal protein 4 [Larimichthys crocea]